MKSCSVSYFFVIYYIMIIELFRKYKKPGYIIGKMYIDDVYFCDTLEPEWRDYINGEEKIPGYSAIPEGIYEVRFAYSPRFKKSKLRLERVPMFSGILIHEGNTMLDTQGCILVGKNTEVGKVTDSRTTLAKLERRVREARKINELVTIQIFEYGKEHYVYRK